MGLTAAVVIVGDEILAGHTQDTNSHWIANRLRERGVRLLRIETVPDEVADVEATLRRLSLLAFDWIIVVGGLGPTPDDRTYEAVGKALGVPLEVRPADLVGLKERVASSRFAREAWADPERSEAMARMIRLPQGSVALPNPVGTALGCVAHAGTSRIAVFPGVPRELYAMFDESFAPRHLPAATSGEGVEEIEAFGAEASFWDALTSLEKEYPALRIGSYPQDHRGKVILRITGVAADAARARKRLLELLAKRQGPA